MTFNVTSHTYLILVLRLGDIKEACPKGGRIQTGPKLVNVSFTRMTLSHRSTPPFVDYLVVNVEVYGKHEVLRNKG